MSWIEEGTNGIASHRGGAITLAEGVIETPVDRDVVYEQALTGATLSMKKSFFQVKFKLWEKCAVVPAY